MASIGAVATAGIATGGVMTATRSRSSSSSPCGCRSPWPSLLAGPIVDTAIAGAGRFDANLFTSYDSTLFRGGGARAGILGSALLMATPLSWRCHWHSRSAVSRGFADNTRWYNRLIEVNVQNLAAVPSVIYGMLAVGVMTQIGFKNTDVVLGGGIAWLC